MYLQLQICLRFVQMQDTQVLQDILKLIWSNGIFSEAVSEPYESHGWGFE